MTPLFNKLNYKNQSEILVLHSPESFEIELKIMADVATIYKDDQTITQIDFVLIFVTQLKEIDENISRLYSKLNGDAVLWFCYPKGTSKKYRCDFNRDTGWSVLGTYNLESVRQVAIDDDWSALRFRKVEYVKSLSRREDFAISDEGKQRTRNNKNN